MPEHLSLQQLPAEHQRVLTEAANLHPDEIDAWAEYRKFPVDEGIVSFDMENGKDQVISVQTNREDFGTIFRPKVEKESAIEDETTIEEEIGSEALSAAGINEVQDNSETREQSTVENHEKAAAIVEKIMGENGKGGGTVGDLLRELGSTPAEIRSLLDKENGNPEERDRVKGMIRVRVAQLQEKFPLNAREGKEKAVPAEFGYETAKMDGPDYVTELVMAKLDGSFDYSRETLGDEDDTHDHRDAAEMVLDSLSQEQVEDMEALDVKDKIAMLKHELTEKFEAESVPYLKTASTIVEELLRVASQGMFDINQVDHLTNDLRAKVTMAKELLEGLNRDIARARQEIEEDRSNTLRQQLAEIEELNRTLAIKSSLIEDRVLTPVYAIQRAVQDLYGSSHVEVLNNFRRVTRDNGTNITQELPNFYSLGLE